MLDEYRKRAKKRLLSKISISKVNFYEDTPCWEWTDYIDEDGYGQFWLNGKYKRAHRAAYELFREPIPKGLTIDHLCENKKCVNTDHLKPATIGMNLKRALNQVTTINSKKTHCPEGHEYTKENTFIDVNGRRNCKECQGVRSRYRNVQKYAKVLLNAECI